MYAWEQDASRKIQEYRDAKKNPYDLFDATKPEFLGNPELLKQYKKTLQQRSQELAAQPAKETPKAPDANARVPNEGIDDWMRRTGKGEGPVHLPTVPISR